jgi:hypothetical protein
LLYWTLLLWVVSWQVTRKKRQFISLCSSSHCFSPRVLLVFDSAFPSFSFRFFHSCVSVSECPASTSILTLLLSHSSFKSFTATSSFPFCIKHRVLLSVVRVSDFLCWTSLSCLSDLLQNSWIELLFVVVVTQKVRDILNHDNKTTSAIGYITRELEEQRIH